MTRQDKPKLNTVRTFLSAGTCSQTMLNVINRSFDNPLEIEEKAADPLAGGIMQHGYQCGLVWGAALAAGARAYQLYGSEPAAYAKAIHGAQKTTAAFKHQNDTIDCEDLTSLNKNSTTMQQVLHFLIKGGTIKCFRLAAKMAPQMLEELNRGFEENIDISENPTNCASLLAQKAGATELQQVMAAGLAGGVGLAGGGCGALATIIWLVGIKFLKEDPKLNVWSDKQFQQKVDRLIDKFMQAADYEFECADIVGQKFDSIQNHADFICRGGCAEIIDTLITEYLAES